jgi:hypothetical protein
MKHGCNSIPESTCECPWARIRICLLNGSLIRKLQASGNMIIRELDIKIMRTDIESNYLLKYVFPPDKQVLIVMKASSNEVLLFYNMN